MTQQTKPVILSEAKTHRRIPRVLAPAMPSQDSRTTTGFENDRRIQANMRVPHASQLDREEWAPPLPKQTE